MDGCRLCGISQGRYAFDCDVPVFSDPVYYGMASIGGFVSGWTLVCPVDHCHNLSVAYRAPQFHQTTSVIVDAVTAEFGEPAIFEHGSTRDGSATACGTNHAHLHVVPFVERLTDVALSSSDSKLNWIATRLADVAQAAAGHEYLFVANRYTGIETDGYLAQLVEPRSQFFRQVLATHLEVPHLADYKVAPLEQTSLATADRLRTALKRTRRRAA